MLYPTNVDNHLPFHIASQYLVVHRLSKSHHINETLVFRLWLKLLPLMVLVGLQVPS